MIYEHDPYYYSTISYKDSQKCLKLLIRHLKQYDVLLDGLDYSRGSIQEINKVLQRPIEFPEYISRWYGAKDLSLCKPSKLRDFIDDIDPNLSLDIRKYRNFPVYFLYRYRSDSYRRHHVLLEEVYASSNYPARGRFIRLRTSYREKIFLNVSPYRSYVAKNMSTPRNKKVSRKKINDQLNRISKILNLAWDEDFDLTWQVCNQFEITAAIAAMEITTLVLCTEDFSWLRDSVPEIEGFFREGYEHPYLYKQLEVITTMTDSDWRARVEQAKRDYVRLRRAISELYRTTVVRSGDDCKIPLWKLAFIHQNDKIPELVEDDNWSMAKKHLQHAGEVVLDGMIKM